MKEFANCIVMLICSMPIRGINRKKNSNVNIGGGEEVSACKWVRIHSSSPPSRGREIKGNPVTGV
jgi:hypothetical protein